MVAKDVNWYVKINLVRIKINLLHIPNKYLHNFVLIDSYYKIQMTSWIIPYRRICEWTGKSYDTYSWKISLPSTFSKVVNKIFVVVDGIAQQY